MNRLRDLKAWGLALVVGVLIHVYALPDTLGKWQSFGVEVDGLESSLEASWVGEFKSWEKKKWQSIKGEEVLVLDYESLEAESEVSAEVLAWSDFAVERLPEYSINYTQLVLGGLQDNSLQLLREKKLELPIKILLAGDSMMIEGLGPVIESRLLSIEGVEVVRWGKYSTGLNRTDYFDWNAQALALIEEHQPDVLVVMFGANDGQPITSFEGQYYERGTDGWRQSYAQKVFFFMNLTHNKVLHTFWLGHPIPASQNFQDKLSVINEVFAAESEKFEDITFVDTWDRFTVNGSYSTYVQNDQGVSGRVKHGDGVHMTRHGGEIYTDLLMQFMGEKINW